MATQPSDSFTGEPVASTRGQESLQSADMKAQRERVLRWFIAFKALKAIALTALAVVLLTTRHADPVDLFIRLALALHLPLTSRLLARAVALLSNLTITRQTALAITAFGYGLLMATEGVALYMRKPWARWFTIIATSSLIPIEVYEVVAKPDLARVDHSGHQRGDRRVSGEEERLAGPLSRGSDGVPEDSAFVKSRVTGSTGRRICRADSR